MESIRYKPVKYFNCLDRSVNLGYLDEKTCKNLYKAGRIDDTWDIEILIPEQDKTEIITEKCSTLWEKKQN